MRAEVALFPRQLDRALHDLDRFLETVPDERRPQDRVALDQIGERRAQEAPVELAVDLERERGVVGRARRLEALEEPEALLGEAEWESVLFLVPWQGLNAGIPVCL